MLRLLHFSATSLSFSKRLSLANVQQTRRKHRETPAVPFADRTESLLRSVREPHPVADFAPSNTGCTALPPNVNSGRARDSNIVSLESRIMSPRLLRTEAGRMLPPGRSFFGISLLENLTISARNRDFWTVTHLRQRVHFVTDRWLSPESGWRRRGKQFTSRHEAF